MPSIRRRAHRSGYGFGVSADPRSTGSARLGAAGGAMIPTVTRAASFAVAVAAIVRTASRPAARGVRLGIGGSPLLRSGLHLRAAPLRGIVHDELTFSPAAALRRLVIHNRGGGAAEAFRLGHHVKHRKIRRPLPVVGCEANHVGAFEVGAGQPHQHLFRADLDNQCRAKTLDPVQHGGEVNLGGEVAAQTLQHVRRITHLAQPDRRDDRHPSLGHRHPHRGVAPTRARLLSGVGCGTGRARSARSRRTSVG